MFAGDVTDYILLESNYDQTVSIYEEKIYIHLLETCNQTLMITF